MPVRYCVAAALSLALSWAWAQEPEEFDDNGTPLYEVNFVDTELGEFIDSVSRITGTTFIVDPRVKGKVTVRTVDLHDADAIYDIFLAQLRAQGYATVDLPNGSVKIVPDQAARLEPVPVEAGGQQGEGSDSVATRVFNVRNAASEQVLGILKPLIDPRVGVITPYPAAHQLVVTDWRSNLERIDSLLRELDFGAARIRDRVTMSVLEWVRFDIEPSAHHAGGSLTIRIEEPEPERLFLRFTYGTTFAASASEEDRAYAEYIKSAYQQSDIDCVRIIRTLAAEGNCQ